MSKKKLSSLVIAISSVIVVLDQLSFIALSYRRGSSSINSDESYLSHDKPYCDEDHCDSIVQKCLRTDRCSCNWKDDARCSKDCIDCLEEKFGKCCGCLDGLCPRSKHDNLHASHVADLGINETDPELFDLLTETEDEHNRWIVQSNQMTHQISHPELGSIEFSYRRNENSNQIDLSHDESKTKWNCTVAFINRELSMTKCRSYCVSMGATSYRWFFQGCCECIGKYCLNYGIDEPRCIMPNEDL